MRAAALFFLAFFVAGGAFGQQLLVSAAPSVGFIMEHRPTMAHLIKKHVWGLEAAVSQLASGEKPWHHLHNFPSGGIAFKFFNLGNPSQLGNCYGVLPFLNFNLDKKQNLKLRYGVGVSYFPVTFDRISNNKNVVISSHFNALIDLKLAHTITWLRRYDISYGLSFTHFSNGSFKLPNLGMNIPALHATISLLPRQLDSFTQDSLTPGVIERKWDQVTIASGGLKEAYSAAGPKFLNLSLQHEILKHVSVKSTIAAGGDLFYSQEGKRQYAPDSLKFGAVSIGVHMGYIYTINKIDLLFQMGAYLYSPARSDIFYHRVGGRVWFSDRIFSSLLLKTHFAVADVIETGIGYRW